MFDNYWVDGKFGLEMNFIKSVEIGWVGNCY